MPTVVSRPSQILVGRLPKASRFARKKATRSIGCMLGEPFVHVTSVFEDPAYQASPYYREWVERGGIRTFLLVAAAQGRRAARHARRLPPEEKPVHGQADRAVAELRGAGGHRDGECAAHTETREALEQQTATAEVLRVINASPGDLAPVFDAMLEKATQLCEAAFGALMTYDGERFILLRTQGTPDAVRGNCSRPESDPGPRDPLGRMVEGGALVHIADLIGSTTRYRRANRCARAAVDLGGIRTLLVVPLRKDGALLGVIHRLPPGSAAVLRQADRAVAEFRSAGGHRDGECAAAGRVARRTRDLKSRSNTRPRPATCCRSSAVALRSCSRCSTRGRNRNAAVRCAITGTFSVCEGDGFSAQPPSV